MMDVSEIALSGEWFEPEFVSFRLRHEQYSNLSEPVLGQYEPNDQMFLATIDFGDPVRVELDRNISSIILENTNYR